MNLSILDNCTEETKRYIKAVIQKLSEMGNVDDLDEGALTILAKEYNNFQLATQQIEKDGLLLTNPSGVQVRHPLLKVANDAEVQCFKIMQDFGLTCKSRKKLVVKQEDKSPLDEFMND